MSQLPQLINTYSWPDQFRIEGPPLQTRYITYPTTLYSLPYELIREIFECLAEINANSALNFPLFLVCKEWWHIAISTPRLWSWIVIKAWEGIAHENTFSMVAFLLLLSRNYPLDITFDFMAWKLAARDEHDYCPRPDDIFSPSLVLGLSLDREFKLQSLVSMLAGYNGENLYRWKRLCCRGIEQDEVSFGTLFAILGFFETGLTEIVLEDIPDSAEIFAIASTFHINAPHLKKMTQISSPLIIEQGEVSSVTELNICWNQAFWLSSIHLNVLSGFNSLLSLSLVRYHDSEHVLVDAMEPKLVQIPTLRTLYLRGDVASSTLRLLFLPRIRYLLLSANSTGISSLHDVDFALRARYVSIATYPIYDKGSDATYRHILPNLHRVKGIFIASKPTSSLVYYLKEFFAEYSLPSLISLEFQRHPRFPPPDCAAKEIEFSKQCLKGLYEMETVVPLGTLKRFLRAFEVGGYLGWDTSSDEDGSESS